MSKPSVVYLDAHDWERANYIVGGITLLERGLLAAQHEGANKVIVLSDAIELPERHWQVSIEQSNQRPSADSEVRLIDHIGGIVVKSRRDRRRAEWSLLRSLPKSFQGPIDALINCHFSLRITRLLSRTPITPNMVTVAALLLGIGAGLLLLLGSQAALLGAGVAMFFQSIIDSCDGELARLRYQFSKFGQWLDNLADDITDTTIMLCFGLATGEPLWIWIGVGAAAARVFSQVGLYVYVLRVGGDFWNFRWFFEKDVESLDEVYDLKSPLVWLRSLGRRDVYLFIWAGLSAFGQLEIATAYGAGIAGVSATLLLAHMIVEK